MTANAGRRALAGLVALFTLGVLAAGPAAVAAGGDVVTLTLVSDATNEYSADAGLTWNPVALPTPHGLYAPPIGTSVYISAATPPNPPSVTWYRKSFDLPADCDATTASLSVSLHVDNDANLFLNDALLPFGSTAPGSVSGNFMGSPEGPYTTSGPFLATGNRLVFRVGDYGLPTALDYQATLTCTTANHPPVADAGDDRTVPATGTSTSVTLDGSGSSDADGDALTYAWAGGFTELTATGASPTVTFAAPGVYPVVLTVDDGNGGTDTDEVVITVTAPTPSPASPSGSGSASAAPSPTGAVEGGTTSPAASAVPDTAAAESPRADLTGLALVAAIAFLVSANALAFAPRRARWERRRG